jgi:Peptidase family M28
MPASLAIALPIALLLAATPLPGADAPAAPRPVAAVRTAITADAVRQDVAELSSDDMGGRFYRSPFAEKAATWISKRFDAIGLAHGAGDGTYRQPIDANPETGPNLIARLDPPAGTPRAVGTIVVSAHYDHLRPKREGADRIYNGADDDASGIAGMLAVARAMKALAADGKGPACTVLFMAFNGEEAGLLGSSAYCKHPVAPLGQVRGVFNMDMISRGPPRQIFIDGGPVGKPVMDALRAANESIGLKLRVDEHADWLDRSDQGPFLEKKVPAVLFSVEDHEDYHQVTDEVQKIDAALAAEVAQLVTLAAVDLSRAPFTPRDTPPAAKSAPPAPVPAPH